MHAYCRQRPPLLALLLLVGVGALATTLMAATKESADRAAEEEPKVVFPPDCAVLLSGNIDVIYRGDKAELEVNSRSVAWEEFYDAPVRVGHVHLSPGIHRVKVGDRSVRLCVALNEMEHDGPSHWKIHRVHTMSAEKDRCAECHDAENREGRMLVGKVSIPDSCMTCHTDREVKDTHQELIQPLKSCDTCHAMHGSPYASLLKAPKTQIQKEYGVAK